MFNNKRRYTAVFLIISILTAAFSISTPSYSQEESLGSLANTYLPDAYSGPVSNIIINLGKDPSSRNITWHTASSAEMQVQWVEAEDAESADFTVNVNSALASKEEDRSVSGYVCRAKLTGLGSGVSYAYRIGGNECGWSDVYTFKTGERDDGIFSFLLIGDAQIGAGGSIAEGSRKWKDTLDLAEKWYGDRIEFLMSAGDQINYYDEPEEFDGYCSPTLLRSLPQLNNVGNHDNDLSYSAHFTFDGVDGATVSDAGKYGGDYWIAYDGALIMSLNTNDRSSARHISFINGAIEEYTALYGDPNWKIITLHHSFYSAAESRLEDNAFFRSSLGPAFSGLGIDAVLMGHDHIYTRAYLVKGTEIIDDPSVYTPVGSDPFGSVVDPSDDTVFYLTVNSSSGSKFYTMYNEELPYVACKNQENTPNFTKVDVTPGSLTFRTYRSLENNDTGDVVDFFAIRHTPKSGEDAVSPTLDVPAESEYPADGTFDPLDGIFAYDDRDGDVTSRVSFTGNIDPCAESVLTYTVTDEAGNSTTAQRTVKPVKPAGRVAGETKWKYLDDGSIPFEEYPDDFDWVLPGYDDSEWKEGTGPFGSKNGEHGVHSGRTENTLINLFFPEGTDEEGAVIPNYFFRCEFDLDDPSAVNYICGRFWCDDGVDIYINGVNVRSQNTQYVQEKIGYSYSNSGGACSGSFVLTDREDIASLGLRKKGNVLAVELYQSSEYSESVFFAFDHLLFGSYLRGMPFEDVEKSSWYYTNVGKAYGRGLFYGVSDGVFAPRVPFTRAMAWTVLAAIAGAKTEGGEKWYTGPRLWAMENGVSDGSNPSGNITREQLAVMLYSLSGKPGINGSIEQFTDASAAAKWARNALCWAVEKGIINGRPGMILDPKAYATRAEACTMLIKYVEGR